MRLLALLALLLLGYATFTVFQALLDQPPRKATATRQQYPTIPACDKPLWDRVKDRCKDE